MPYSQELGMRVYDPEEGARIGLGIGDAFTQSMQNAQRRQLSEREIALQERQQQRLEDEAARQARYMVRRQRGLQNMAYDYQDLLKVGATPDVAQRMSMIQNLPDIMEGATPQAIEGVLRSDEANQVRLMTQQLLNERLQKTLDLRERLASDQIQARRDIVKEQIQSKEGLAEKAGEQKQLDRESREDIATKQIQSRARIAAQKDPLLQKINQSLADAQAQLADVTANPHWWKASKLNVQRSVDELKKQRAERLKELGVEGDIALPEERAGEDTTPDQPSASTSEWKTLPGNWKIRKP